MKNLLNKDKAKWQNYKPFSQERISEEKEIVKCKLDKLIPIKRKNHFPILGSNQ